MEFPFKHCLNLVSFRYAGQGRGGGWAQGRVNWDRSFDAHISVLDEGTYMPAISLGLRDFIGTGWYSSEYVVGTKSIGNLELTAGLGFGRLAGRDTFSNPLSVLSSRFDKRDDNAIGRGGTLGTINWFQGDAATFYGLRYHYSDKITVSAEYTADTMSRENSYLDINSPWNFGVSYQFNDFASLSTQYLHGSQFSLTAQIAVNPGRPPMSGGKELAPVPMRMRGGDGPPVSQNKEGIIRRVFAADRFDIHYLKFEDDTVNVVITNTKFRSTAQAIGRLASTLQRFTSDEIKFAHITVYFRDLQIITYRVDLEKVTFEQFNPGLPKSGTPSIIAIDQNALKFTNNNPRLTWGLETMLLTDSLTLIYL